MHLKMSYDCMILTIFKFNPLLISLQTLLIYMFSGNSINCSIFPQQMYETWQKQHNSKPQYDLSAREIYTICTIILPMTNHAKCNAFEQSSG